jgi:hypothetical protein
VNQFPYDPFTLPNQNSVKVRHDASATSLEAAKGVLPRSGTQRMRILEAISKSEGMTDVELAEQLDILLHSVNPRRPELQERGWIVDSGLRRATGKHGASTVWVLSPVVPDDVKHKLTRMV